MRALLRLTKSMEMTGICRELKSMAHTKTNSEAGAYMNPFHVEVRRGRLRCLCTPYAQWLFYFASDLKMFLVTSHLLTEKR